MAYFDYNLSSASQHDTPTMQLDPTFHDDMPTRGNTPGKMEHDWTPMISPYCQGFMPITTTTADEPILRRVVAPQGLGLMLPHVSDAHAYDSDVQMTRSNTAPSWAMDWTYTQPPVSHLLPVRRDSWDDACDTISTLQPPVWPPFNHISAALDADGFPGLSSCSASPHTSPASSPGAYPEDAAESPAIKVEAPSPHPAAYEDCSRQDLTEDQSFLVSLSGALTQVKSEEAHLTAHASWSAHPSQALDALHGDCKPILRSQCASPHHHVNEDAKITLLSMRPKRQFTKSENAVCHCHECGKPFQRRYNMKAHMVVHNADRPKPYGCPYEDCPNRFSRRTDLVRHERCVHLKSRSFACNRCGHAFSRKDTLRRHFDDGCPKRSDIRKRIEKPRQSASQRRGPATRVRRTTKL